MKRLLYWFFLISPILLHVVINLSLWCHLPNRAIYSNFFWCGLPDPISYNPLWFYAKFIWFAPAYWVAMNLLGFVQGSPKEINKTNAQDAKNVSKTLLIISYVSKGVNQETLARSIRQTQQVLDFYKLNYAIEVATDHEILNDKRVRSTKGAIHYYRVPDNYKTKTNVKYKARALQYLLEQRTTRLGARQERNIIDIWVLHLDEESVLTKQAVIGIYNFIKKYSLLTSNGAIGQGEVLYNSYKYGKHVFITAADALRTGDDLGRFRFQYKKVKKPISGMHGSFLLIPATIEKELTWDSGARSQLTEDAYLALKAMENKIQFDWIDGFIKEQSPFTFKDFLNQRARWLCGLAMVITDSNLKFASRIGLALMIISWSVTWLATFVTIANIVSGFIAGENYFPFWAVVSTSIITGVVGSVYMIGAYRNVLYWDAPIWKKIFILLVTYFLFLFQILAIMEGVAVISSIIRIIKTMIFRPHQDFYVVAKD